MKNLFQKIHLYNLGGVLIGLALFGVIYFLSYILMHNPYRSVHEAIMKTAENVRGYYRDSPGYWKLNTDAAVGASLAASELSDHGDFNINIGQGPDGDMSMPYNNTFDITVGNLNKSACISLSEIKISKENSLGLQKISIITDSGTTEFLWGDGEHKLPISKWETRHICQTSNNKIMWTFQ